MKRKHRSTSPEPGDLPDLVDVAKERARKCAKRKSEGESKFNLIQGETSGPPKPSHQVFKDDSCVTPNESPGPSKSSKQTPKGVSSATITARSGRPETVESTSRNVPCATTTAASGSPKSTSESVSFPANIDTSGRQMSLQDDRKKDSTDKSGRLKLKLKLKVLLPKLELSKDKTYSLSFICNLPTLFTFKGCTKCENLLKVSFERTSSTNRGRQK